MRILGVCCTSRFLLPVFPKKKQKAPTCCVGVDSGTAHVRFFLPLVSPKKKTKRFNENETKKRYKRNEEWSILGTRRPDEKKQRGAERNTHNLFALHRTVPQQIVLRSINKTACVHRHDPAQCSSGQCRNRPPKF